RDGRDQNETCMLTCLRGALQYPPRRLTREPDGAKEVLLHVGVPVFVRYIKAERRFRKAHISNSAMKRPEACFRRIERRRDDIRSGHVACNGEEIFCLHTLCEQLLTGLVE